MVPPGHRLQVLYTLQVLHRLKFRQRRRTAAWSATLDSHCSASRMHAHTKSQGLSRVQASGEAPRRLPVRYARKGGGRDY